MLTTLSGLAQYYLTECEALGRGPTTVATYRHAINDFLSCVPDDPAQLDRQHCLAWLAHMRRQGKRPGGIASYQRMV